MWASLLQFVLVLGIAAYTAAALMPYSRSLWDTMLPADDPLRILEQTPFTIPKSFETLALAHTDWKETPQAHILSLDVPGVSREDIKIEVEESRVLRISVERKAEAEVEKWHRAERTSGKFWKQLRMPASADMDAIEAHLEDGVLTITVPKLAEEKKRQPRFVNIVEDIKPSKGHV